MLGLSPLRQIITYCIYLSYSPLFVKQGTT